MCTLFAESFWNLVEILEVEGNIIFLNGAFDGT